jgi:hypothetical protein
MPEKGFTSMVVGGFDLNLKIDVVLSLVEKLMPESLFVEVEGRLFHPRH